MKCVFKSSCPITSALDVIGDRWTLIILKQMLFENKQTFKDFKESKENIASNILTRERLEKIEFFHTKLISLPCSIAISI